MVENSLKLVAWEVSEKPFRVKEFEKTFLALLQILDENALSPIMFEPRENGLAGFRHL